MSVIASSNIWGARAYKKGESASSNPFKEGTANHNNWLMGWLEERDLSRKHVEQKQSMRIANTLISEEELISVLIGPLVPDTDLQFLQNKLDAMFRLPEEIQSD